MTHSPFPPSLSPFLPPLFTGRRRVGLTRTSRESVFEAMRQRLQQDEKTAAPSKRQLRLSTGKPSIPPPPPSLPPSLPPLHPYSHSPFVPPSLPPSLPPCLPPSYLVCDFRPLLQRRHVSRPEERHFTHSPLPPSLPPSSHLDCNLRPFLQRGHVSRPEARREPPRRYH